MARFPLELGFLFAPETFTLDPALGGSASCYGSGFTTVEPQPRSLGHLTKLSALRSFVPGASYPYGTLVVHRMNSLVFDVRAYRRLGS